MRCVRLKRYIWPVLVGLALLLLAAALAVATPAALQLRAKELCSSVQDIRATMVITDADRQKVKGINPALIEALNIKEMDVFYGRPDKFRAEALAKGMQLTWILNGDRQLISVPGMMIRKVESVGDKPGRKRSSLDMGFVSDHLWTDNHLTIVSRSQKAHTLKLVPKREQAKRHELITVEPQTMKLLTRERYSGDGTLSSRYVYSDFRKFGNLHIAQKAKIYDPQGSFAGTIEYRSLRANTGLSPSLFSLSAR